jgi:CBS domain-containing protein
MSDLILINKADGNNLNQAKHDFYQLLLEIIEKSNEISSIFFDYELVFGEGKIQDSLDDLILKNTKNNALFFDYLGNDTLRKNPPINFFKKFNLEEEGEHKGKFDIKNRAIMPEINSRIE